MHTPTQYLNIMFVRQIVCQKKSRFGHVKASKLVKLYHIYIRNIRATFSEIYGSRLSNPTTKPGLNDTGI